MPYVILAICNPIFRCPQCERPNNLPISINLWTDGVVFLTLLAGCKAQQSYTGFIIDHWSCWLIKCSNAQDSRSSATAPSIESWPGSSELALPIWRTDLYNILSILRLKRRSSHRSKCMDSASLYKACFHRMPPRLLAKGTAVQRARLYQLASPSSSEGYNYTADLPLQWSS